MAHRIEDKGPEHVTWAQVATVSNLTGNDAAMMAGWINERVRAAYQQGREDGWEAAHSAEGEWA